MTARAAGRRIGAAWMPAWPAARLGTLRAAIGVFAVVWIAVRWPAFAAPGPTFAFAPVGAAAWLATPLPEQTLHAVLAATLLCGVGFAAGFRFALSGPVFAGLLLFVTSYRSSFGMVFHTENLLVLHVAVLALSPAAEAVSFDARRRPAPPREDGRHGWPVRCLALATVLGYVMAGVAKLQADAGGWLSGEALRQQIAWDNLRKLELGGVHSALGVALVRHPAALPALAWTTLALELGAPLALLGGIAARLWVAGVWLFHVGVLALMAVFFPYPLLGLAFLPFFPVDRLLPARRRAQPEEAPPGSQPSPDR